MYTERISPTVYFNVTQTPIAKKRFFNDMKSSKPELMLIPRFSEYQLLVDPDMRDYVSGLIGKDYDLDRCLFGYNIYRVRGKDLMTHNQ